jgi:hypothetical protein
MGLYERLKGFASQGVVMAIFVSSALLSVDRFSRLYQQDRVVAVLATILAIETVAHFSLYWWVVVRELDLLNEAFDEQRVAAAEGSFLSIGLLVAAGFGILMATSTDLAIYAGALGTFQVAAHVGQNTVMMNVARLYRTHVFTGVRGEKMAEILFEYYLEKPLLLPIVGRLTAAGLTLTLAVTGKLTAVPLFSYVGYVLLLAAIPVSETFYATWRRARDKRFKELSAYLAV